MNSQEYWQRREEEALKHYIKDEAEYRKEINRIYSNMLDSCNEQINAFYGRYAGKEGITLAEAKKRVSELDIKAYERKAKRYVKDKDFSPKANEEMLLYNATMKINRFEMLKANIGLEMIAGHDDLEKFMGGILKGRTEEELARQAGILGKTVRNNAQLAHAIPNASFHNANFSDRIWLYQDLMKAVLDKLLQNGLIQGKNPRQLARELEKYVMEDATGGAKYRAEMLMITELARVQTEAQKQSFERNGFEEYTFHANSGCCGDCQALDGKHFKVKDMMPGKNAAPMHPRCRCSSSAYSDRAEYEEWLDFLEQGGTTEDYNKLKKQKINKSLTNSGTKDSTIQSKSYNNLDIDELTPCLRRLKDNKIVNTEVFEIKPKKGDFEDWEFDWLLPEETGHTVFALKANGDERIQGLIALKTDSKNNVVHIEIVEAAPFNNPHNKNYVKKEYNGVGGHLFAEAVRQSYEAGYGGAVYFTAKSDLIEHYQKELGAVLVNPRLRIMLIEEEAAENLYNRYYGAE